MHLSLDFQHVVEVVDFSGKKEDRICAICTVNVFEIRSISHFINILRTIIIAHSQPVRESKVRLIPIILTPTARSTALINTGYRVVQHSSSAPLGKFDGESNN